MATIDNLDVAIHMQYARRMQFIEQMQTEYRLEQAYAIPAQTQVLDLYPRLSELDLLLGIVPRHAPWAFFFPPRRFSNQRRGPFSFSRVAPSLGSLEQHEADLALISSVDCQSEEEEQERSVMQNLFGKIEEINDMIGFIIGRVGQFLQG